MRVALPTTVGASDDAPDSEHFVRDAVGRLGDDVVDETDVRDRAAVVVPDEVVVLASPLEIEVFDAKGIGVVESERRLVGGAERRRVGDARAQVRSAMQIDHVLTAELVGIADGEAALSQEVQERTIARVLTEPHGGGLEFEEVAFEVFDEGAGDANGIRPVECEEEPEAVRKVARCALDRAIPDDGAVANCDVVTPAPREATAVL